MRACCLRNSSCVLSLHADRILEMSLSHPLSMWARPASQDSCASCNRQLRSYLGFFLVASSIALFRGAVETLTTQPFIWPLEALCDNVSVMRVQGLQQSQQA